MTPKFFYSPRGMPLVYYGSEAKRDAPVLTVENYCKWYELFLVEIDGKVTSLHFGHAEGYEPAGESYVGDHIVNPKAVKALCEARGYDLDWRSYEMLIGRWEIEHKDNY